MKELKDLTPAIMEQISIYKERCIKDLYNGTEHAKWKREYTVSFVERVYNIAGFVKPVVIIADSPTEYKILFNAIFKNDNNKEKLTKEIIKLSEQKKSDNFDYELEKELESRLKLVKTKNMEKPVSHWLFLLSEYARVYLMWYKFINKEFDIPLIKNQENLDWLYENVNKSNIAKVYLCDKIVLVLRMPEKILRNEIGFHTTTLEPSIKYKNDKIYHINGRKIESWIFEKYFAKTLTFEDFIKIDNEDEKAGIITLIKANEGEEGILKFLKAELIDEQVVKHSETYSETLRLFKTKESYSFLRDSKGNTNVPYAWLEETCPSTGQVYLIYTDPSLTDAVVAAKTHRGPRVPMSVPFQWHSAN